MGDASVYHLCVFHTYSLPSVVPLFLFVSIAQRALLVLRKPGPSAPSFVGRGLGILSNLCLSQSHKGFLLAVLWF